MATIRELISLKQRNCVNNGGSFTFSVTQTPEAMKEIEEMGEEFTHFYNYTVSCIPGMITKSISISKKSLENKKNRNEQ